MSVLILKNIASEGPGTIAEHLDARGIRYTVLEAGEIAASTSLDGHDTLVVLGGPMGVYEMQDHPHMYHGVRLIQEASRRGMKALGVCLGAQMMAHALGGRVYKGHGEESGWLAVKSTDEGRRDAAFGALTEGYDSAEFMVLQWHGDTFDIPPGGVRLASSVEYPNQAFVHGGGCYAMQFHIEVTPEIVGRWFKGRADHEAVMKATAGAYAGCRARAERFYARFFG